MKHNILIHSIAVLLVALPFARAEDDKPAKKKDDQKSETKHSSSSVITSADGTATVTIDINGKKETRTFKLGDGNNSFSFGKEGDGAKAAGDMHPMLKYAKHEKGPWLGIAMEPVQDVVRAQLSLAPGEGIVVGHVAPESPAAKAGLQPNDILLRFEDQIIVEPGQLKKLIAMRKAGDSVKLAYLRKGEKKDATVSLIEHEIEPGENNPAQWLQNGPGVFTIPVPGGRVENRLENLQEQFKQLKEKRPGVIVDKRAWVSGSPEEMLKGQIEKLKQSVKNSDIPKEEAENIIRNLEHMQHEAAEALEHTKRNTEEIMKNAQRAIEDVSKAINGAQKPHEKEKGEQKKKPGEPQ